MISATVVGNLGRDAELRQAGADNVCSFSIASSVKQKGEEATTWVRCSLWGKRGESLVKHLRKGTKIVAIGSLTTREHDGKTYIELRVNELEFAGAKSEGSSATAPAHDSRGSNGNSNGDSNGDAGQGSDQIPF
jgi:single-strand DNA-binding protein